MKLQTVRKQKKLTQRQLSELSGISYHTITNYEKGYRNLDNAGLDVLTAFAIALDCKLTDLIESEELLENLKKIL